RMAEDENEKRGRLATAVLAGSALAFGSFVMGIPAAFAENEEKPEISDPASTESGTPESPNDVDNEESPEEGDSTGEPELPSSQSPEPSAESTESSDMSTNQVDPDAPDPEWGLSAREGQPGSTVQFPGTGFVPNGEVEVTMSQLRGDQEFNLGSFGVDDDGNLIAPEFQVPTEADPGTYVFNISVVGLEMRSEEHTSELQSRFDLVCRLLLEKKNNTLNNSIE